MHEDHSAEAAGPCRVGSHVWSQCIVATRLAVGAEASWGCRLREALVLVRSGDDDNVRGMPAVIRVLVATPWIS
jgi:hypothetical protein